MNALGGPLEEALAVLLVPQVGLRRGRLLLQHLLGSGVATGARLPLPGLSRDSYTLIGYYEDKGVSLRAAYTYRSAFLSTVQSAASGGNAYSIGRGQLDASAQINLTRNVRLTVDAINLTKEIAGQYLQTPERLSLTTREDRRIFFGIAAAF